MVLYLNSGKRVTNASSPCGSNPGLTRSTLSKLLKSKPAPIKSSSESATSATTKMLLGLRRRKRSLALRPPSFMASARFAFEYRMAGKRPNITPVRSDTPTENHKTALSASTRTAWKTLVGSSATSAEVPQSARRQPRPPPIKASITLSVRSCRIKRKRFAPTARRTENSLRREVVRERERFATLAHAMSSTNPTPPHKRNKGRRSSPKKYSCNGWAARLHELSGGYQPGFC